MDVVTAGDGGVVTIKEADEEAAEEQLRQGNRVRRAGSMYHVAKDDLDDTLQSMSVRRRREPEAENENTHRACSRCTKLALLHLILDTTAPTSIAFILTLGTWP